MNLEIQFYPLNDNFTLNSSFYTHAKERLSANNAKDGWLLIFISIFVFYVCKFINGMEGKGLFVKMCESLLRFNLI